MLEPVRIYPFSASSGVDFANPLTVSSAVTSDCRDLVWDLDGTKLYYVLGADATAAAAVQARGDAYDAELVALDAEIDDLLADLPDRQLVTDHDAFAYFADRYDLEVVGTVIPSFDSSAEVSAGDLDDLAATIRRTGTRAIFTEQSLPPDAAEALARKVDVRVVTGDDGLYGDSLGPADSPGATYLGMMRHNADSISRNLR